MFKIDAMMPGSYGLSESSPHSGDRRPLRLVRPAANYVEGSTTRSGPALVAPKTLPFAVK